LPQQKQQLLYNHLLTRNPNTDSPSPVSSQLSNVTSQNDDEVNEYEGGSEDDTAKS